MIHNEGLTWVDVGNISTDGAGGKVRDAFQLAYSEPARELLPAGMSIYKFNAYSTLCPDQITDATSLSPWWSPVSAFKHDGGLEQRTLLAQKNGVSLREWGRLTSVIKENWSSMAYLLTISLKVPVYAWFGGFKGMVRLDESAASKRDSTVESKGTSKNLPGGGTQFYIPNLKFAHIGSHSFKPI